MRALILSGCLLAGCATTPATVLGLLDAQSDSEQAAAVEQAARYLKDSARPYGLRATAAQVLGRLRLPSAPALEALRGALLEPGTHPLVRAWSAHALGQLRSEASLAVLVDALRVPLDAATFQQVLEGLSKHFVLLTQDSRRVVEVVEAMIFAAGNQSQETPPVYDLLGAKMRTVEVNVEVLSRAIEAAAGGNSAARAALYQAASELLAKLEASQSEVEAGPEQWRGRIAESMRQAQRAVMVDEPRLQRLVLLGLGRMAGTAEFGRPAAEALVREHRLIPALTAPSLELALSWTLTRLELQGVELRRALDRSVLARSSSRPALRLIAELSPTAGEPDGLQRILRLSEAGQ